MYMYMYIYQMHTFLWLSAIKKPSILAKKHAFFMGIKTYNLCCAINQSMISNLWKKQYEKNQILDNPENLDNHKTKIVFMVV